MGYAKEIYRQAQQELDRRREQALQGAARRREELGRVLIFCNTKHTTALICDMLTRRGVPAQCIHGDMIQKDRNRVMAKFKEGEIPVMVATDVAARGIDVNDIDAVINYEFPQDNET